MAMLMSNSPMGEPEPEKFVPDPDHKLDRRIAALEERLGAFPEGGAAARKVAARLERLVKAREASVAAQELAWKAARGLLALQRGSAPEASVRRVLTYSYKGVPHAEWLVTHKAVPSGAVPHRNPKRDRRRSAERVFAAAGTRLSSRQWVRLRKAMRRDERAEAKRDGRAEAK